MQSRPANRKSLFLNPLDTSHTRPFYFLWMTVFNAYLAALFYDRWYGLIPLACAVFGVVVTVRHLKAARQKN
jgi:hypothetical protein